MGEMVAHYRLYYYENLAYTFHHVMLFCIHIANLALKFCPIITYTTFLWGRPRKTEAV